VYHSGSTAGYRAHLNRFPDAHTSVAVLCNGSNGDATRSANNVSAIYLAGRLKPPAAIPISDPPGPPSILSPPLSVFEGDYSSDEAETTFTVAVVDGGLVLKRRPDTVIKLSQIASHKFRSSIGTVTFILNAAGAIEAFSVNQERVWDLRFTKK